MPRTYEEHLRNDLMEEGDQRRIREMKESGNRTSQFESRVQRDIEERIKDLEKRKQEELLQIQKKTEEKLKEIERKQKTEKSNYKKTAEEMQKAADEELKSRADVYDQIISRNKNLLLADQLTAEKELLKAEEDLREIRLEIEETVAEEREKMDAKREEMMRKQIERDEEKMKETIENHDRITETKVQVSKEVAKRNDELHEKRNQHATELENANLSSQINSFRSLQITNHKYNHKVMNELVKKITNISDTIIKSHSSCERYLQDGFNWNDGHIKRAKDAFDNLSNNFHKSRKELTNTERRLAELEEDKVSAQMSESIKQMRAKLFSLNSCTAKFCGNLMAKNTIWKQEDKNELEKLMFEFSEIKFPNFDSKNKEMESHLNNTMPNVPEGPSQIQQ